MTAKTPLLLPLLTLFLSACGPARVNVQAVARNLDQHKPGIAKSQEIHQARSVELAAIVKQTSTPHVEPYPTLRQQVDAMKAAIAGMHKESKRIDAFKPKFQAYAAGKTVISQEDTAAWNEYQGVMAEYNAIHADLRQHASAFNSANIRYDAMIKTHNIARLKMEDLRAEISGIAAEVSNGVTEMEKQVPASRKALDLARQTGADPALLEPKSKVLDKMNAMLPGLKLFRSTVSGSKDRALKDLAASGEIWTGPGMNGQDLGLVDEFREVLAQYRENRKAWDDLNTQFEAPIAAAPTPTAQP